MYENLRDMLEREVKEVEKKNDLDPQSLENIYKLTCAIKNVDKIMMKEEGEMDGMSKNSYGSYRSSYGMHYGDNGRYSEDNFRYSPNRGRNSYENHYGYSRDSAKDSMVNRLMQMADGTMNEHDRMAIMDCVDRIK
jgi:hypothetical protein